MAQAAPASQASHGTGADTSPDMMCVIAEGLDDLNRYFLFINVDLIVLRVYIIFW